MFNKKKILVLFFIVSILFAYKGAFKSFLITKKDLLGAQNVFGISFSNEELDTLRPYLERNLKGYKKMRGYPLGIDVEPITKFEIKYTKKTNLKDNKIYLEKTLVPEKDKDIAYLPVYKLAYLIKNQLLTSERLTKIYLRRLKKHNTSLNVLVTLTEDLALKQAKKADEEIKKGDYKGALHGIPYGVKDLASHPNYPTTWGAAPYKDQYIKTKAVVIKKLEDAGAVLLGKLSSGALARGDVWFGGKTKNPWNVNTGSSGSSAGSASATAAGLVGFSIGTETLGSIISPSTRCGVTGLRPTYGIVSKVGIMSLSWTMDKVGPICRSSKGCAIVLNKIKGKDEKDSSIQNSSLVFNEKTFNLNDYKIGYLKSLFDSDSSENGINNEQTLNLIQKLGGNLIPIELPKNYPFEVFDIILRAEAGAFFDKLLLQRADSILTQQNQRSRANSLRQSRFIPAVEYIQANRFRSKLIQEVDSLLRNFDIIISPTFGGRQMLITNLTGHPALSVPNGFNKNNSPTSITILGNYFEEGKILSFSHFIQKQSEFHTKKPPGFY